MIREDLLKTLKLASPALLSDNEVVLPILKSFLFTGDHVIASNDVLAVCLATEVTQKGIVPGKKMINFLSVCRTKEVKISLSKQKNLLVRCGSSRLTLPMLPKKEWPFEFPDIEKSVSVTVGENFFKGIELCSAQSPDTGIGSWSGSIIFSLTTPLRIYGIGRGRITVSHYKVKGVKAKNEKIKRISVPSSFCKAAVPMSREYGVKATLHIGEDSIVLDWGDGENVLTSKLVNADGPDVVGRFKQVVNQDLSFMPITTDFVSALKRAATIGDKGTCQITNEELGLRLRAKADDGSTLNDLVKSDKNKDLPDVNEMIAADLIIKNFDNCQEIAFDSQATVMRSESEEFIYLVANRTTEEEEEE